MKEYTAIVWSAGHIDGDDSNVGPGIIELIVTCAKHGDDQLYMMLETSSSGSEKSRLLLFDSYEEVMRYRDTYFSEKHGAGDMIKSVPLVEYTGKDYQADMARDIPCYEAIDKE